MTKKVNYKFLNKSKILTVFDLFSENNKNPRSELYYINDITCLIAIILSAQSTDKGVNKVTQDLFIKYNTIESFASLSQSELESMINKIGLYKQKAKNIINTCKILLEQYNKSIPSNFNDLIKLPGVGRKTANVFLNALFGHKTIGVDTHVYRVSRRIGFSCEKDFQKLENDLIKKIPDQFIQKAHHWLVLHGRYVCKARKPNCENCLLSEICKKNLNF